MLKITREDLERLRATGATIRSKGSTKQVTFTAAQLNQFRDSARAARSVPEAGSSPAPEIDMDAIHDTIHEAVGRAFENIPQPEHPTYHFEVSRDGRGFIKSIRATPEK